MEEKRRIHRDRTYLGGQVVFNNRRATMDCLVRNMSQNGAKLVFSSVVAIPGEFDLRIPQKGDSRRARVVWRRELETGVAFGSPNAAPVVSIEEVQAMRLLKQERDALALRVAQLSDPA